MTTTQHANESGNMTIQRPASTDHLKPKNLTAASLETFKLYASDADNWGGTPWVNGNIQPTKYQRGNLSDLVKKGLIKIQDYENKGKDTFVVFTDSGKSLAADLGIEIGEQSTPVFRIR